MSEGLDGALPQGSGLAAALPQGVWACWCAAAGGLGLLVRCLGFRWGWSPKRPRPGGLAGGGSGSRAVASVGRKDLRSCAGTPRLLRLLRDPVTNAEAFDRGRTKEESWVPLGVGWAALLPSRGTVHEKGEALPPLTRSSVDLQPDKRSCGCRSTDGTRKRRFFRPPQHRPAARDPRPAPSPAARSRPFRSAGRVEAAPTQPQVEREATPTQPQVEREPDPTLTRARRRSPSGTRRARPRRPRRGRSGRTRGRRRRRGRGGP